MDNFTKLIQITAVCFFFACLGLGLVVAQIVTAHGQENPIHQHGAAGIPDWYDPECCNTRDCRPVNADDVEEIDANVYLYKPEDLVFKDTPNNTVVRDSKDGRYHVCSIGKLGFCIYVVRSGV